MRNIDRLRQMNDEEIFNFFETITNFEVNEFCDEMTVEECRKYNTCVDCRIAWLKKEYKGDGNNV